VTLADEFGIILDLDIRGNAFVSAIQWLSDASHTADGGALSFSKMMELKPSALARADPSTITEEFGRPVN
jgi:hypothetical protein